MPTQKITIGTNEYELSPLKIKHLRKISKQIEETSSSPRKPSFADLDKWTPFILDSITVIHQDAKMEVLDEMTLEEFGAAWTALLNISGFKIVSKGEAKPTEALTSNGSTDDSPSAAVGPIQ